MTIMIKKIEEFLINENIKQMRAYLTSNGLSTMEDELSFIKDKFTKKPNLIYPFVKMMVDTNGNFKGTIEQFNLVADWIINKSHLVNKLPQNVTNYISIEELQDDIRKVDIAHICDKFYNSLYRSMKITIDNLPSTQKQELDTIVASFMLLPNDIRKTFPPLKYFEANHLSINDLSKAMESFITNGMVNSSRDGVLSIVSDTDNAKIVYDKNNVLIIQSNDRELITTLGSNRWCIVYAPNSYFDTYVGGYSLGTQYLVFNFNLPQSSKFSLFGISINTDGKSIHGGCQDRENNGMSIAKITAVTGITELPQSIFTNIFTDLIDNMQTGENPLSTVIEWGENLSEKEVENTVGLKNFKDNAIKYFQSISSNFNDLENALSILDDDFYMSHRGTLDTMLACIFDSIDISNTDMILNFQKIFSNLENIDDLDPHDFIFEHDEEYYNYPDKFETYGNRIVAFGYKHSSNDTMIDFIAYKNTPVESEIHSYYKQRLLKALDADSEMISTIKHNDWDDLKVYFEDTNMDFQNPDEAWIDNYSTDDWETAVDDLTIDTLISIAKYYISEGNEDFDHDTVTKYDTKEYRSLNYSNSRTLIYQNKDHTALRELYDIIREVIAEDESDDIKDSLSQAYSYAYASGKGEAFHKEMESQLGNIFIANENGSHATYEGDKLLLKVKAFELLSDDDMDNIITDYGEEFGANEIVLNYLDMNRKLSIPEDVYGTIDEDYLNERIIEEMEGNGIDTE